MNVVSHSTSSFGLIWCRREIEVQKNWSYKGPVLCVNLWLITGFQPRFKRLYWETFAKPNRNWFKMKQGKSDVWFFVSGTCVVLRKDLEWDLENTEKIQETIGSGSEFTWLHGSEFKNHWLASFGSTRKKGTENSFQYFSRLRIWWVIITTLYLLTSTSWYQQTAQSSGNKLPLILWHNRLP